MKALPIVGLLTAILGWGITIGVYKTRVADLFAQVAAAAEKNVAQDVVLDAMLRDSATQSAMYRYFVCSEVLGDPEAKCKRQLQADMFRIELADSVAQADSI